MVNFQYEIGPATRIQSCGAACEDMYNAFLLQKLPPNWGEVPAAVDLEG